MKDATLIAPAVAAAAVAEAAPVVGATLAMVFVRTLVSVVLR